MKKTSLLPKLLAVVAAGTFAVAAQAADDQVDPSPNVEAGTGNGQASNTGSGTGVYTTNETTPAVQTDDAKTYPNVAAGTGRGTASHTGSGTGADSDGNPNVDDAKLPDASITTAANPVANADDKAEASEKAEVNGVSEKAGVTTDSVEIKASTDSDE